MSPVALDTRIFSNKKKNKKKKLRYTFFIQKNRGESILCEWEREKVGQLLAFPPFIRKFVILSSIFNYQLVKLGNTTSASVHSHKLLGSNEICSIFNVILLFFREAAKTTSTVEYDALLGCFVASSPCPLLCR